MDINPQTGCKCTFAQHMVGDGCDICNSQTKDKSSMPDVIWAWELIQTYDVLCPISYKTTEKTDITNGFYDTEDEFATQYTKTATINAQLDSVIELLEGCQHLYDCEDYIEQALTKLKEMRGL